MKTAADLKNGDTGVVLAIKGGMGAQRNLTEMGIIPGCRIEAISAGSCGRILLKTTNGRFALGHGLAAKILLGGN